MAVAVEKKHALFSKAILVKSNSMGVNHVQVS